MMTRTPVKNPNSMVAGINGKTIIFTGKAMTDTSPVIFNIIGRTAIWVERVEATISRIPNFSGMNVSSAETFSERFTRPRVARNDS